MFGDVVSVASSASCRLSDEASCVVSGGRGWGGCRVEDGGKERGAWLLGFQKGLYGG